MNTITLDTLKAEHERLAERITAFEKQREESVLFFPKITIHLAQGERCAGLIIGKAREPSYYLILLPGEAEDVNWNSAMEWAGKQGGKYFASLPTRREQSLLFANLKEEFQQRTYWSYERREEDSAYAWHQNFLNGYQYHDDRNCDRLCARAVRRVYVDAQEV